MERPILDGRRCGTKVGLEIAETVEGRYVTPVEDSIVDVFDLVSRPNCTSCCADGGNGKSGARPPEHFAEALHISRFPVTSNKSGKNGAESDSESGKDRRRFRIGSAYVSPCFPEHLFWDHMNSFVPLAGFEH